MSAHLYVSQAYSTNDGRLKRVTIPLNIKGWCAVVLVFILSLDDKHELFELWTGIACAYRPELVCIIYTFYKFTWAL